MTNPWAPFLSLNTPQPLNSTASNTTAQQSIEGLIPLSDYRIITLSGPDAFTFLQGQCTCDFKALASGQWVRGAHCNPKGRMISSFTAAQIAPEIFGLRVHHSIATTAANALKKYLVFSKAKCTLSELLAVGITQATATKLNLTLTPKSFITSAHGLFLASEHFGELWLETTQLQTLMNNLSSQGFTPSFASPVLWQQLMIEQGIAEVTEYTTEKYLPQAFNYDAIGAVSFKKGCYTGQEIIARLHYKGQSKQRLHILQSDNTAATIGQSLQNEAGKAVGEVINTQDTLILACTSAYTAAEPLKLAPATGDESIALLTPIPLPYPLA